MIYQSTMNLAPQRVMVLVVVVVVVAVEVVVPVALVLRGLQQVTRHPVCQTPNMLR